SPRAIRSSSSCPRATGRDLGRKEPDEAAHAVDPPRDGARRRPDFEIDPRARGIRAPGAPDGSHGRPDSPPRLRTAALLRGANLPPRPRGDRLRALLLHVLDLRGPPDPLPRGPVRASGRARARRG